MLRTSESAHQPPMLTTIVTDSPRGGKPNVLMDTIASLTIVPGLADRVRIVFDGGPLPLHKAALHKKCRHEVDLDAYNAYKQSARRRLSTLLTHAPDWQILELSVRGCLNAAVHKGLANATTPFVALIQNDLPVRATFDLSLLLRIMREHREVKKVSFSAGSNRCQVRASINTCKVNRKIAPNRSFHTVPFSDYGMPLTPVAYWFDGNHVASAEHYRTVYATLSPTYGGFMEDFLFCKPWVQHEPWGTFLLGAMGEDDGHYSFHRDSRNAEDGEAGRPRTGRVDCMQQTSCGGVVPQWLNSSCAQKAPPESIPASAFGLLMPKYPAKSVDATPSPAAAQAIVAVPTTTADGKIDTAVPEPHALERLAKLYGTDKQVSQHRYTNYYSTLFDEDRREQVLNVTEAGILRGSSVHMWVDYFPRANVWGLDVDMHHYREHPNHRTAEHQARMHLLLCCKSQEDVAKHRLVSGSMDLVIDDAGLHSLALQEMLFPLLWPLVKPGGYYVIEDVDPQRGGLAFTENHSGLSPLLRSVLETHSAFMVDSTPGITPSAWSAWQHKMQRKPVEGKRWVASRSVHNSHLLVIRKSRVKS